MRKNGLAGQGGYGAMIPQGQGQPQLSPEEMAMLEQEQAMAEQGQPNPLEAIQGASQEDVAMEQFMAIFEMLLAENPDLTEEQVLQLMMTMEEEGQLGQLPPEQY